VQVRVFEFEAQRVPGQTGTCEMPVTIDEAAAVVRLREAMEGLRERMYGVRGDGKNGSDEKDDASRSVPVIAEYDQAMVAERTAAAFERMNGGTESPAPCLPVSQSQGLPVSQEGSGL
jgi:hypothetical protein